MSFENSKKSISNPFQWWFLKKTSCRNTWFLMAIGRKTACANSFSLAVHLRKPPVEMHHLH